MTPDRERDLLEANNRYQQEARDLRLKVLRIENEQRRVERNRDMWQSQCERQAEAIADLRSELAQAQARFDLVAHLRRQRDFSLATFGPGTRTAGMIDHIRKELEEIEADPTDVEEWIDVIILAFDGAWRAGFEPSRIVAAIVAKQAKNEKRRWPDWRTADPDRAIEHDRSGEGGTGILMRHENINAGGGDV